MLAGPAVLALLGSVTVATLYVTPVTAQTGNPLVSAHE